MGTELEWKYAVPEPAVLDEILAWTALRDRIAGTPQRYHMQSDYYDTPDRRLSCRRITLRRRMENEASVFCVKAPLPEASDPHLRGERAVGTALCRPSPEAEPHLRGEWETEAEDLASALPRLEALGAPTLLPDAPSLRVQCRAEFIRRAVPLRFADGSEAELALDFGTLSGVTRSAPLCELELELKAGDPAAARSCVEAIAARFSLRPEPLSKFARASALDGMQNA